MNRADMSAIAVVKGDSDRMAIWHVGVEPVAPTSRLCGAWVTNDLGVQEKVTATRKIVLLGVEPKDRAAGLLSKSEGAIDLAATARAITNHTEELSQLHRASRTPKGAVRQAIKWPSVPPMPDPDVPPDFLAGVVEDPLIRSVIAMARWIADLADTWQSTEMIRSSREHLSGGNLGPMPLPFVFEQLHRMTSG